MSCPADCGVCSVCGNDRCEEDDYENCINCPADCGACDTITCDEVLMCSLGCIDFMDMPPEFRASCLAVCMARACADVLFLVDEFLDCAIWVFFDGGGLEEAFLICDDEYAACMGVSC